MDQFQSSIDFFFEQLSKSMIREILLRNTERTKAFKALFAVYLCATHTIIFVSNAKLVHRRSSHPA
jgi:hypothetical protein